MIRVPLATLTLGVALVACGDNAPSKREFLAEADPICRTATSEATGATTPTDVAGLRHFHFRLAEGADKTVAGVAALKFPGGDDGKAAKAWVQSLRDAATAARAVVPEVDTSDYTGIETTARKAADAFKAADALARTFGSAECGRGEAEAVGRMSTALSKTVKSAYITTADAMCKAAWAEMDKIPEGDSFADFKAAVVKVVPIEEKLAADLKAIPAPVTDKDKLDEVMAAFDKVAAKDKELLAVTTEGAADDIVAASEALSTDAENKADAYGFIDCGSQVS